MKLTPEIIEALKAEKQRRLDGRAKKVVDDLHDGQKRVIWAHDDNNEPHRRVALACHRRWGKTNAFFRYAGWRAQTVKRYNAIAIYQELKFGKKVAWPILQELAEDYRWDCKFNGIEMVVRFRGTNGAIHVLGADDERRHRLLRGQKPDDVLIDEAQDWYSDIERLIQGIAPGLADRRGRLFMCGTPPDVFNLEGNYFLQVCRGDHKEWHVVRGRHFENPHTAEQLRAEVAAGVEKNPNFLELPWVRREYFGEFVVDARKNVIHVDPAINYLTEWHSERDDQYIISIDWGDDIAAYAVATFNTRRYDYLVYLEAHALHGLLIHDHVNFIRSLLDRYPNAVVVADPGGVSKSIVRELREVHRLPIVNAKKDDRIAQIELMNSDLSLGKVRLYNVSNPADPAEHPLAKQWRELIWLENRVKGTREESRPRDIHDAALYARRYAHTYLHVPKSDKPEPGSPEYDRAIAAEMRRKKEARIYGKKRKYR